MPNARSRCNTKVPTLCTPPSHRVSSAHGGHARLSCQHMAGRVSVRFLVRLFSEFCSHWGQPALTGTASGFGCFVCHCEHRSARDRAECDVRNSAYGLRVSHRDAASDAAMVRVFPNTSIRYVTVITCHYNRFRAGRPAFVARTVSNAVLPRCLVLRE